MVVVVSGRSTGTGISVGSCTGIGSAKKVRAGLYAMIISIYCGCAYFN